MMSAAGSDGVAAISIAMYVEELLLAVYMGYSEGVAPFSAVLSFCHTMVFLIGMLMLLPKVMGLRGVWLAGPTAEFLSMLMSFAVFRWKAATYRY